MNACELQCPDSAQAHLNLFELVLSLRAHLRHVPIFR